MNAVKFDTTVDEAIARAVPALRPLLGKHIEVIALDLGQVANDPEPRRKISFDELLALRLDPPPGVGPQSVEDIKRAIAAGALDGNA